MNIALSDRVQQIQPSPTLSINAKAAELRAAGKDIISLGVGEPDFDTPQHIKDAAAQAIRDGLTKYTPVDGLPSLKQAIINKFASDNGLDYDPKQILASSGAKQSLYNLFQALLNPGDEVIIPAPYWVSYPAMAKLASAEPVIIKASIEQDYKITPEQLERAITPKTRLLILNSPSNPTGVAYTKAELSALAQILRQQPHVTITTDDIYEHILWSKEPFCNIVNVCPELYSRTVVINGVSKAYAMTGWRLGYAAGAPNLIAAMKKIQSQSTSNPCSITQAAAQAALESDQSCVREMVAIFKQRYDAAIKLMGQLKGIECAPANGAFYLFPRIEQAMAKLNLATDVEFAEYLLDKAGVAVVPGSAFGAPGYMRLSYAVHKDTFKDAITRIGNAIGT